MSTHNERGTDQQPWKSLIFASQNSAINGTKIALLRDENAKTNLCELAFANQSLTIPYNEHLVMSPQALDLMNKFTLFPATSLKRGFTIRVKLWIYHCCCQIRHEHRLCKWASKRFETEFIITSDILLFSDMFYNFPFSFCMVYM